MKLLWLALLLPTLALAQSVGPGSPSHFLAPSNAPLGSYTTLAALQAAWPASQLPSGGGPTAWIQGGTQAGPVFWNGTTWVSFGTGTGSGTVTSAAFDDASTTPIFAIGGSPITTSGTITETLQTQLANLVFAGPATGSAAQPSLRLLVAADIPTIPSTSVSGLAASATTDTTNAGNITSGTLGAARMPLGITATPAAGALLLGNAGATAYASVAMSGDGTIASTGVLTNTQVHGLTSGSAAAAGLVGELFTVSCPAPNTATVTFTTCLLYTSIGVVGEVGDPPPAYIQASLVVFRTNVAF